MPTHPPKTREELIEELYQLPDHIKAEIIDGAIVPMSPTGVIPGRASGMIFISLVAYERRAGWGMALPNNVALVVDLPGRGSFSPDTSFCAERAKVAGFFRGAPLFAVEVRSENDYGPRAERAIRRKIDDYFAAGAQVVWDVDALRDRVVRVYRANDPDHPTLYGEDEEAEAEPALPGWRMAVREIMDD
jgi:Uma2 family endonuclease